MTTGDEQLLQQYVGDRSDEAFGELVRRHIGLVYAAALRLVNGDNHLAQDVTQTVFIDLARKAPALPHGVILAGWLHRHTCYTASTAVRTERRRRLCEQTAMEMRDLEDNAAPPWELVAPHLDEALNQLRPVDRDALVLRFLKRQDLRSLGAAFGISEDAAQKRVSRALDALRSILARRGVALSAGALASLLAAETVTAAPGGLVAGVAAAALTAARETGTTFTLLKLMAATKFKLAVLGAIVIAGVVTPLAIQQQAGAALSAQNEALSWRAVQLAHLRAENDRLSNLLASAGSLQALPNAQRNEVLSLRGEIGRLQRAVQELTGPKTNEPLSRNEMLASLRQMYSDRVTALKQRFAANPAEAVPELKYLTDADWLRLVTYDEHLIDPDHSRILSRARGSAQAAFGDRVLAPALRQYAENNNGQFPSDLSQLAPYFKSPVDEAVLQDWAIVPTSSLPSEWQVPEEKVITQNTAASSELEHRVVIGLRGIHLGPSPH